MEEILLSKPLRACNHPCDGRSAAIPVEIPDELRATIHSASPDRFHLVPQGSPLGAWLDASPRQSAPGDAAAERKAGIVHRLFAAFRVWRRPDRSLEDLYRLSDDMLKDIGLHREDLGQRFMEPRRYIE
jgi:uncharacterized protein YjiS (DUF1127 family)